MHLGVTNRALISVALLGMLCCGCANAGFDPLQQIRFVEQDVPGLISPNVSKTGKLQVGDAIVANMANLKMGGWFVEEASSDASHSIGDKRYEREYIVNVPARRMKEDSYYLDYSTGGMVDNWQAWSILYWDCFLRSKDEFDASILGHYFRAIAPDADRIYDVVIFRPANPESILTADPIAGNGIVELWKSINPPKPDRFPRLSIFGTARYVVPASSNRFNAGHYHVLEVYDKRYLAFGTFLGAEFGSSRTRDTYILVLSSKRELIAVQIVLFSDAKPEIVLDDLGKILAAPSSRPAK